MRNIYHQSAGNPIQPNRLPLTSSSIKLFAERWRANSWHTPVWMLSYGAISLLLLVYMKASGITLLLHPFDLLLSPAFVIFALILGRLSEPHRQIMTAIAIVATALLGISSAIPAFMQLLLFAGRTLRGTESVSSVTTNLDESRRQHGRCCRDCCQSGHAVDSDWGLSGRGDPAIHSVLPAQNMARHLAAVCVMVLL